MVKNGISVDVDEFVSAFADSSGVILNSSYEQNIHKEIDYVLKLLDDLKISATFFINGKSVVNCPDIIKKIHDAGHELGCHGYSHKYINQYSSQKEFENDLEQCLELIFRRVKIRPIGYRTPGSTIYLNKEMVLNSLKKFGFVYDSSLTSVGSIKQHGYSKGPLYPFKWENGIIEFPYSSAPFKGIRIPAFGTYFLKLFPVFLTDMAIRSLNRKHKNVFFYFHGFELNKTKYPKEIMNIDFPKQYVYCLFSGRSFEKKLRYLLGKYHFVSYRDIIGTLTSLPEIKELSLK